MTFQPERLVERDAFAPGFDLYDRRGWKVIRCRSCHLGFSPADDRRAQERAVAHVACCGTAVRRQDRQKESTT